MAKDKENKEKAPKLSKEELAEQKQIEKDKQLRAKERTAKRKQKEKKAKDKQKTEIKRIKTLISLPFKVIVNISVIAALLSFLITFFILNKDPISTLITSFFVFTLLYLGIGALIVGFFIMISIDKEKELNEIEAEAERQKVEEENRKKEEELRELESIEREISHSRFKTDRAKQYIEDAPVKENEVDEFDAPHLSNAISNEFNPLDDLSYNSSSENDYVNDMFK
jgi:uncharacterized membrane protein